MPTGFSIDIYSALLGRKSVNSLYSRFVYNTQHFLPMFQIIQNEPVVCRVISPLKIERIFIRSRTCMISGVYLLPCPSKNINLVTADSVVLSYPETTPACSNWYPVS